MANGQAEPLNPSDLPPLYENSVTGGGPQRPKRRQKRDDPTENSQPQTICRSVSFLQKKSYQECFNSAIEKQLIRPSDEDVEKEQNTSAVTEEAEDSKGTSETAGGANVQTTNGVEWEFQDLSLYLGSFLSSDLIAN